MFVRWKGTVIAYYFISSLLLKIIIITYVEIISLPSTTCLFYHYLPFLPIPFSVKLFPIFIRPLLINDCLC